MKITDITNGVRERTPYNHIYLSHKQVIRDNNILENTNSYIQSMMGVTLARIKSALTASTADDISILYNIMNQKNTNFRATPQEIQKVITG